MNPGRLIAIEGIDGCGKSTQVARLGAVLSGHGRAVLLTREPTDGPTGQRIRAMARADQPLAPSDELRWFLEDRRIHVREVIEPGLRSGAIVLTDRYYLSTVAYQGARGLDPAVLLAQSEREFPVPDLALVLEIPVEQALARVGSRASHAEPVFEERAFLERVAELFASLDRPYVAHVDARGSPDAVHDTIVGVVGERLGLG